MKTARFTARILHIITKIAAIIVLAVSIYAISVVLLYVSGLNINLPMTVLNDRSFRIFYPFTDSPFLLGDYTSAYLTSNLFAIAFYGLFLWLLSDVFHALKQSKLFTSRGVKQLSRFYLMNLLVPVVFIFLLLWFGNEVADIVRIIMLHLVIGVFAYFMAAIFRQGLLLQEEQDLTF